MRMSKRLRRREAVQRTATVPGPGFAPRLTVRKASNGGAWLWDVWEGCRWHDGGTAPTQPAALALGLAALDTAQGHAKLGEN